MSAVIRPLAASDEADWRRLWAQYLEFYGADLDAAATDSLFTRLIAGTPHFAFVAEQNGVVIGAAHALPHASTWSPEGYCYLEDLFVDTAARGAGAGRSLIEAVYEEADRRGLTRVYWHTDTGNSVARGLYDKLATLSDFIQYRRV